MQNSRGILFFRKSFTYFFIDLNFGIHCIVFFWTGLLKRGAESGYCMIKTKKRWDFDLGSLVQESTRRLGQIGQAWRRQHVVY